MKIWTDEEVKLLKIAYRDELDKEELARVLGRSLQSLYSKAKQLGISNTKVEKQWTDDDINYIKMNYKDKTKYELAHSLGRSIHSVYSMGKKLNLTSKQDKQYSEYAAYKGDTFLAIGTLADLSLELGIKYKNLLDYTTPRYMKRAGKNSLISIKV